MSVFFQTMAFMCTKAINRPFRFWHNECCVLSSFLSLFSSTLFLLFRVCRFFTQLKKKKNKKKDFIRSGSNPLDVCVFLIPMAAGSDTQATLVNWCQFISFFIQFFFCLNICFNTHEQLPMNILTSAYISFLEEWKLWN